MPSYVPPKKNTSFIFETAFVDAASRPDFKASPTIASGDFKISIDGTSGVALAANPAAVSGATSTIRFNISGSEMNGDIISIMCIDAAGAEWDDQLITIHTAAFLSDDISAGVSANLTAINSNAVGISANLTAINSNAVGISANIAAINSNATALGILKSDTVVIRSDTLAIVANVSANLTAINSNAVGISANLTAINSNATALGILKSDTVVIRSDTLAAVAGISANLTAINSNALATSAVATLVSANLTAINSTQARLPAALSGGNIKADVLAISTSTEAADNLEASAETIVVGAAEAGTLSTTVMTTNLTEATDDHYNGRIVIWTSGVLQDQASDITAYLGATGRLTYTAVTEAPSAADSFIVV